MRKETVRFSILLISIAFLVIVPVIADDSAAQPQLPHAFYGIVESGGSPVGQGMIVEAVGPGVRSNIGGNPVTTLADGSYGSVNFTSQKLLIQGNIVAGTRLDFYVGGMPAEVRDVAAGGPWMANYSFQPGELTELNLRVASLPAAGQTREPTPVQTVAASSNTAGSTGTAASSGAASGGALLPQLPDSPGQQPVAGGTYQVPEDNAQAGSAGQGTISQGASDQSGGQESDAGTVSLPVSGNMTLYIAVGILLLLGIVGGAYYYTHQKKSD
jgi:hypothetical protein